MNPIGKKFISLFLVFSIMMLSVNLYAKKRGAKLIITQKDGQLIEGELITVKPNSLLLLNTEGRDVSVDIEDAKVITIITKAKFKKAAGLGFLVGAIAGIIAVKQEENKIEDPLEAFIWRISKPWAYYVYASLFGGVCALIGGLIGTAVIPDKVILIEGMTDQEIQETLDKLRKKARIRDYK